MSKECPTVAGGDAMSVLADRQEHVALHQCVFAIGESLDQKEMACKEFGSQTKMKFNSLPHLK